MSNSADLFECSNLTEKIQKPQLKLNTGKDKISATSKESLGYSSNNLKTRN